MFDRGETFAGVPYDTGLKAVARLKQLFRDEIPLAHVALRWILMREEVGWHNSGSVFSRPGENKPYGIGASASDSRPANSYRGNL